MLVDLGGFLQVHHVAGVIDDVDRHAGGQPLGVARRNDLILAPDGDGQLVQAIGQMQRLN